MMDRDVAATVGPSLPAEHRTGERGLADVLRLVT